MIKAIDLQVSDVYTSKLTSPITDQQNKNLSKIKFGDYLNDALETLNHYQVKSSDMRTKYIMGEIHNIHDVIITGEEAKLLMNLTIEVRNKIIEAYKEISRMPI